MKIFNVLFFLVGVKDGVIRQWYNTKQYSVASSINCFPNKFSTNIVNCWQSPVNCSSPKLDMRFLNSGYHHMKNGKTGD